MPSAGSMIAGIQVLSSGEIIATTTTGLEISQDGRTWTDVSLPGGAFPRGSAFLTGSNGWVATLSDDVMSSLHTQDGGQTWESSTLPGTFPDGVGPTSIDFLDSSHGWIVAMLPGHLPLSAVYATSDGGKTWTERAAAPLDGPMDFADQSVGWAVGGPEASRIYGTTDAGKSWNPIALPVPDAYAKEDVAFGTPSFFDSSSGVVPMLFSGDLPALVVDVTTDGGKTWSSTTPLAIADANPEGGIPPPFSAVNSADWFMATPGGVYRTTDGGKSWTSAEANVSLAGATGLAFSSAQTGWALTGVSSCSGFKTDCTDATPLYESQDGGTSWTVVTP
jgi:photosystem II stability/assembly factor-like uncharacterized protein